MEQAEREFSKRPKYLAAGVAIVFLGLFYLYAWLVIGPHLIYHRQSPVFLTTLSFFKSFLNRPGGVAQYVSIFFWQFCYFPWAGALVMTVSAWLICLATRWLLTAMAGRAVHPATYYFPGALLLMAYSQYEYDLVISVSVLTGLLVACLHIRTASRRAIISLPTFLVLVGVVYYLAGSAYVVYGLLCGLFELLRKRRTVLGLLYVLSIIVLPNPCSAYLYKMGATEAYSVFPLIRLRVAPSTKNLLHPSSVFQFAMLLSLAILAILAARWPAIRPRLAGVWAAVRRRPVADTPTATDQHKQATAWRALSLGLFAAIAVLAAALSFAGDTKAVIEIDYLARHKMWPEVLKKALRVRPELYNVYTINDVNNALYHTGYLANDMFTYPQSATRDGLFLTSALSATTGPGPIRGSNSVFQFGLINEAEHWASESLEINGPRPETLNRLVEVNVLKGLPEAARTFLGALGKNLLYREWAKQYLRKLDADPAMAKDTELQQVRPWVIDTDYTTGATGPVILGKIIVERLERVLESDKHNKMAFEFLMAHYLYSKRLDKVVANIHRLDDLGYRDIPRHFEEAIVIYLASRPAGPVDLRGRRISHGTLANRDRFLEILSRYRSDKAGALNAMRKDLDRSYFLYYTDDCSVAACKGKLGPSTAAVTGATK